MDAEERAGRIMIDTPKPTPGRQVLGQAAADWDSARDYIAEQIRQAEQAAREDERRKRDNAVHLGVVEGRLQGLEEAARLSEHPSVVGDLPGRIRALKET